MPILLFTVFSVTTMANSDSLVVMNNLSTFIFSLIRALGLILLGFGIVQIGLSLKSHDPSQKANGFLTLAGGVIILKIGNENEVLEFKKSTGELKEGVISIASILNKHNRGELYFGVRNDGTPVGQMINDETLRKVSQAIANHIDPKIYPSISQVVISDRDCILVKFEGENVPYFAYGRGYIRVADEDKVMLPDDLERYILKKNEGRTLWDSSPSNQSIEDISQQKLVEYIKRAKEVGRINFNYTSSSDVLEKLELVNGENINNAAKVMFSKNPRLEVQMAIFATDIKLTFNDIRREMGTVQELVDIAEQYIRNNMRWRVVFDGSVQRKEIPEVPIEAIREALVNSYCHRLYDESMTNEVAIFRNRIEIFNPGTFPEGFSPEDFIKGNGKSIRRNPTLAQLLYYSKDIENFGTGLARIQNACNEAEVKVEFVKHKFGFSVVFYRKEPSQEEDYFGYDKPAKKKDTIQDTTHDTTQDTTQGTTQEKNEVELLKFCEVARSREEMQSHIGITNREYFSKAYLKPLLESGRLKRTIPDKPSSRNQRYISG